MWKMKRLAGGKEVQCSAEVEMLTFGVVSSPLLLEEETLDGM